MFSNKNRKCFPINRFSIGTSRFHSSAFRTPGTLLWLLWRRFFSTSISWLLDCCIWLLTTIVKKKIFSSSPCLYLDFSIWLLWLGGEKYAKIRLLGFLMIMISLIFREFLLLWLGLIREAFFWNISLTGWPPPPLATFRNKNVNFGKI